MSRTRVLLGDALTAMIDHRGKTPKKLGGDWSVSGHRVVSAMNVKDGRVDSNDHHYVNNALYERWMKEPLKAGDVLLTSEAPTGEVAFLEADCDWCLGQRLFGLRGEPGLLDGRYLFYLLRGGDVRAQLMARSTGTTVSGIRQSELLKVELDLPPVEEQQEIATTLGAFDDKIESNRRTCGLLWSILKAEYEQLTLTGTQRPLKEVLSLRYGKALPATARALGDVPVYGSSGVTGWHNAALIAGPAVIVGRKGSIGEVHWSDSAAFPIDTTFYVEPEGGYPLLACYFALAGAGLRAMNSDSAVPGLNRERVLTTSATLPSHESAIAWANRSVPLVAAAQQLTSETGVLENLRDTLLPELCAGRHHALEAAEAVV
jgi:type I restriction enzyme S subunit